MTRNLLDPNPLAPSPPPLRFDPPGPPPVTRPASTVARLKVTKVAPSHHQTRIRSSRNNISPTRRHTTAPYYETR
ncbi:hypothetical protein ACFX15_014341 [Malus domestica]